MIALVFMIALMSSVRESVEQVDKIEINTVVDECGKIVLTQVIFWEWSPEYARYHVRSWQLVAHDVRLETVGSRHWQVYYTGIDQREHPVVTKMLEVTRTPYDPERLNLKVFAEKYRLPLRHARRH